MAFKSVKLVLCLVCALTATCHQSTNSLVNGNLQCLQNGTLDTDFGNYSECNKEDYSSIVRYQTFGIDCCIEEARVSMGKFFDISEKIALDAINVSFWTKNLSITYNNNNNNLLQRNESLKICNPEYSDEMITTTDNIDSVFMEFSSTCKRYTDVMAFKNQLQCHVFNSNLTSDAASQLTNITIKLQIAAVELQNIEVSNL